MLRQANVIGQAFNKWIVVKAGTDIVLVDQVSPTTRAGKVWPTVFDLHTNMLLAYH